MTAENATEPGQRKASTGTQYEPPEMVSLGNVRDILAGATSGIDDGKSGRGKVW